MITMKSVFKNIKNHGNLDDFLLKRKYRYLCEDQGNQGPTVGLRAGSFGYQSNYMYRYLYVIQSSSIKAKY